MIVIVLLIILAIFGIASMMQSYASARQADAQIATAHAAQIASAGNLVSIVTTMLIVLAVVVIVAAVLFYFYKKTVSQPTRGAFPQQRKQPSLSQDQAPQMDANQLMLMMLMDEWMSRRSAARPTLQEPREADPSDQSFHWLR